MKTRNITFKQLHVLVLITFSFIAIVSCNSSGDSSAGQNKETVKTPSMSIHQATFLGNLAVVESHIAAGTNLNAKDEYGSTPLIIATTFDRTEIAKALINAGADLNIKSKDGSTALHTAAFFCRIDIVKALLAKGADKNIRNSFGSTPLESVLVPFNDIKPVYEQLAKDLGALGLKLDYDYLEKTRPVVAQLLENKS